MKDLNSLKNTQYVMHFQFYLNVLKFCRINIKMWHDLAFYHFWFLFFFFCSESDSLGKHGGNVSLDVLPVKGPQSSPLSQVVHPPQEKPSSEEMWTVHPEHLILVAPSACEYVSNNMTGMPSVLCTPGSSRIYMWTLCTCSQWLS